MYKTPEQWLKKLNIQADPSEIARFMDAQKWLDQKYPNKQKVEEITHDNGIEKFLIGELTIKDFPKLKKVSFISSGDLLKLKITNCPQLDDFECVGSPIKEIDFGDSNKLDRIYIPDNLLETIKLPANPVGLVKLHAHNNKFSTQTLQILEPFAKKRTFGFGMTSIHYEYSAKDKEELKSILSKQVSQTTEIPSSSTSSQSQERTETPKKSLAQLQAEHAFYKNFFDSYLQNKRSELTDLRNKMDEEGNKQLDAYLQLQQPENRNKNREKRLKKNLLKKLTNEELQNILDISKEISDLEKKVNDLEMAAQMEAIVENFQTSSWFQGWFK